MKGCDSACALVACAVAVLSSNCATLRNAATPSASECVGNGFIEPSVKDVDGDQLRVSFACHGKHEDVIRDTRVCLLGVHGDETRRIACSRIVEGVAAFDASAIAEDALGDEIMFEFGDGTRVNTHGYLVGIRSALKPRWDRVRELEELRESKRQEQRDAAERARLEEEEARVAARAAQALESCQEVSPPAS